MIPQDKLRRVLDRFEAVRSELNSDVPRERFVALSRELSELTPVVEAINALQDARQGRAEAETMLADREMAAMAREELERLDVALPQLEHDVQIMLLPKDAADERNVILEVRAGTGGDEAALFAGDLFR
ncbi:PCRF domain-containing protein, partial [Sphingomonas sp. UBA4815]|uniref:PCRF domain-containing protein n=1 Tax=Sphingomonas sp. UBA4815 TaxID=1947533 RepID=UPI0031F4F659